MSVPYIFFSLQDCLNPIQINYLLKHMGHRKYDKSVDLWAIACIMGEITDTEPLFPGDDEIHTLYLI